MAPRSSAHWACAFSMPPQARGLRLKRDVEIRCGNGREVLGDVLLRVGVVLPSQFGVDGGGLVRRHAVAASKRHVLLRMRHPRNPVGVSSAPTSTFISTVTTGARAFGRMTTRRPLASVALVGSGCCAGCAIAAWPLAADSMHSSTAVGLIANFTRELLGCLKIRDGLFDRRPPRRFKSDGARCESDGVDP